MQEDIGNIKIYCLTEDPRSILMWSHYGGRHTAACLGFKRTEDGPLGNILQCFPVNYSTVYPTPSLSSVLDDNCTFAKGILATKSLEWAYEREWRMFGQGDQTKSVVSNLVKIKSDIARFWVFR